MFSPRDTLVPVSAQKLTSGGVLLEVRDSGVGIPPSRLTEINWRLDNPPLVDVSVSQHMGLFAASRLAARNGVRIRLRAATPRGLSALIWLPANLTSRAVTNIEQRPWQLAEDSSVAELRVGGRHTPGRHTPGRHTDGGGRGGAEQPAAAAVRSTWFSAKRPSGRTAQGADAGKAVAGWTGTVAARGETVSAAPAAPAWSASSTPVRQAPRPESRWDDDAGIAEAARTPVLGDRTTAGLPVRVPGANMIPGSVGGGMAGAVADATQAPGRRTARPEAEPVMPSRRTPPSQRSPELARNRLSGFQLGSREAETQTPRAGEEASP
jgi:hypothetical protein